jgi:hypothetical protein
MIKKILNNKQGVAMSLITMLILILAMGISTAAIVGVIKIIGAPKVGENSYGAYEAFNSCVQWYTNNNVDISGCGLNDCIKLSGGSGCAHCGEPGTKLDIIPGSCYCYLRYDSILGKKINAKSTGVCNSAVYTDSVVLCKYDCNLKVCGDDGCGGSCGECLPTESCLAGTCI